MTNEPTCVWINRLNLVLDTDRNILQKRLRSTCRLDLAQILVDNIPLRIGKCVDEVYIRPSDRFLEWLLNYDLKECGCHSATKRCNTCLARNILLNLLTISTEKRIAREAVNSFMNLGSIEFKFDSQCISILKEDSDRNKIYYFVQDYWPELIDDYSFDPSQHESESFISPSKSERSSKAVGQTKKPGSWRDGRGHK